MMNNMKPESKLELWLEETSLRLRTEERPLVTLSYAQSLDGCIARERGKPLALSGLESRRLTHQLRASHNAILVGIGTVQADNPQLTVRLVEGESPIPVILDSKLAISPRARLFQNLKKPILGCFKSEAVSKKAQELIQVGATILPVQSDDEGQLSLPHLLKELFQHGIKSVMVEGGAKVISAFLQQKLVDRVMLTITPVYVGGLRALENTMSSHLELRETIVFPAGGDVIFLGEFTRGH
jgi:3,4-dihydroxy 2-butanone 4-phosphate synthase/GTP cyclohydrolase II